MADERVGGTVRNLGGKVQEGFGKVTGDTKTEVQGLVNQAAGAVQGVYGNAIDAAAEGAQTVKDAAVAGHDTVKKFVEENPHTAVAIAMGIGLFIGYSAHRQPQRRYWWD
jgi:uncharacterized protein YjbJ (UPF0337 family)